jgi:hypothetical protein
MKLQIHNDVNAVLIWRKYTGCSVKGIAATIHMGLSAELEPFSNFLILRLDPKKPTV